MSSAAHQQQKMSSKFHCQALEPVLHAKYLRLNIPLDLNYKKNVADLDQFKQSSFSISSMTSVFIVHLSLLLVAVIVTNKMSSFITDGFSLQVVFMFLKCSLLLPITLASGVYREGGRNIGHKGLNENHM